nr:hypothetical protein [Pseudarthrobacter psychrotolerans]
MKAPLSEPDRSGSTVVEPNSSMFLSARHGRFTPRPDAQPSVGAVETGEQVSEVRVKCVVELDVLDGVVRALRAAHHYEEPAFMSRPVNGWR